MKRKNIISLFLLSAGCMLPLCASAQHVYSLDECIEAALDNNVRMKNAQKQPPHGGTQQTRGFQ